MTAAKNWILLLAFVAMSGCAMCDNSQDVVAGAYGGVRDRIDRHHGRVGSLFDPAATIDAASGQAMPMSSAATPESLKSNSDTSRDNASTDADTEKEAEEKVTDDVLDELKDMIESLPEVNDPDEA